jgi:hypothetical protein
LDRRRFISFYSFATPKQVSSFFYFNPTLFFYLFIYNEFRGPVKQTLKLMRTYVKFCSIWPSDWRPYKRWVIFRHYLRYLTRAYQKNVYVSVEDETTK